MKRVIKWCLSPRGVFTVLSVAVISGMLCFRVWVHASLVAVILLYMNFGGKWAKSWKEKV